MAWVGNWENEYIRNIQLVEKYDWPDRDKKKRNRILIDKVFRNGDFDKVRGY